MYFQTKYFWTGNKQTLPIVIDTTSVEACRQNITTYRKGRGDLATTANKDTGIHDGFLCTWLPF
jgi:hypothetical protein